LRDYCWNNCLPEDLEAVTAAVTAVEVTKQQGEGSFKAIRQGTA